MFSPNLCVANSTSLFLSDQMPSPLGAGPAHEKKIGHRRVDASGETTYKKARMFPPRPADCPSGYPRWRLASLLSASRPPPLLCRGPSSWASATPSATWAPNLRGTCWCRTSTWWRAFSSPGAFEPVVTHSVSHPSFLILICFLSPNSEGSNLTPAHHFSDFRFKTYAPVAFRYFRELFGIRPDDYLVRRSTSLSLSATFVRCIYALCRHFLKSTWSVNCRSLAPSFVHHSHTHTCTHAHAL